MMLSLVVVLALTSPLASAIVCLPEMCESVTQHLLDCKGGIIKNGGFCGCTDVCAKVKLMEGEICQAEHMFGMIPQGTCDSGLHCQKQDHMAFGTGLCVKSPPDVDLMPTHPAKRQLAAGKTRCEQMRLSSMISMVVYEGQCVFPHNTALDDFFVMPFVFLMRHEVGHYVKAVYDFTAQESGELSLRVGDIIRLTDVSDKDWLQGEAIYGGSGIFPANFVEKLVLPDTRMGQRVFVALMDFPAEQNGDLELTKGDIILGLEQVDENWWKGKIGPLRDSLASQPMPETVFARALVDVVPQIEGELGFQVGDLITVKEIVDDDWFYGECHNKAQLPNELSFNDNEIVTLIQHVDEDWIEGELDGKIGLFPANFVEIIVDCPPCLQHGTDCPG
nr:hypothetical protein BaRGS_011347 [Batillaria attramentaria]